MFFVVRLLLARILFHPLEGLTWSLLREILRAERYRISIRYLPKICLLLFQSVWQTVFGRQVRSRYGARIAATQVAAPVFVLGHYRSGTTHLHELLSLDPQFASPTRFQAYHPGSFLVTERWFARFNDFFMLPRRVQEDEIGLMNLTGMSPYLDWCFPESQQDYFHYLTFRDVADSKVHAWKTALRWYLAALTLRYNKPILLKSPPHTARIKTILDVFPDAKFVHIRRNPIDVYVSTAQLLKDLDPVFRLRVRQQRDQKETILKTYQTMYDAFFEDLALIPPGQFVEIAYEDLERTPLEQLALIYAKLEIEHFAAVQPSFTNYLGSIAGYQKNRHKELDLSTRRQVEERWSACFDRWNYTKSETTPQSMDSGID